MNINLTKSEIFEDVSGWLGFCIWHSFPEVESIVIRLEILRLVNSFMRINVVGKEILSINTASN